MGVRLLLAGLVAALFAGVFVCVFSVFSLVLLLSYDLSYFSFPRTHPINMVSTLFLIL